MTKLTAIVLLLFAVVSVSACKDVPGADGRYATHDHGWNNHP